MTTPLLCRTEVPRPVRPLLWSTGILFPFTPSAASEAYTTTPCRLVRGQTVAQVIADLKQAAGSKEQVGGGGWRRNLISGGWG